MNRFYGYNRSDYHFSRSCREAFGSDFETSNNKSSKEVMIVVIYILFITFLAAIIY